jgi:Domain of Unknown Function (DUF1080)
MRNRNFPVMFVIAIAIAATLNGCASKSSTKKDKAAEAAFKSAAADSAEKIIAEAAKVPVVAPASAGWKPIFDGKTLSGWRETDFGGHGPVEVESGLIVLGTGDGLTGVNWTNTLPKVDYEIALEAMRVQGSDFFCGLTFPVADSHCSLILGGWGGAVTGLSSIDGQDASENETTQYYKFETGQWYHVRVRVTATKIEAWVDDKQIVDVTTTGKKISLRYGDIEMSQPLGVATWQTTGALREIKLRPL